MLHTGGKRSLYDRFDFPFGIHPRARQMVRANATAPPQRTNNRAMYGLPDPWDQGGAGSCEAFGCGRALLQFTQPVVPGFVPSFLDLYARARTLEGTPLTNDSGVYTRDMLKTLQQAAADYHAKQRERGPR